MVFARFERELSNVELSQIHLPVDFVAGDKFAEDATATTVTAAEGVPAGTVDSRVGRTRVL